MVGKQHSMKQDWRPVKSQICPYEISIIKTQYIMQYAHDIKKDVNGFCTLLCI